jgi:ferredoxin
MDRPEPPAGRKDLRKLLKAFNLRRLTQLSIFLLFVFLLLRTEYRGYPEIRYPVNVFFQLDPYLAMASMTAARKLVSNFWPVLIVLGLTLVLGRVFCGWFCPMGALLDFLGRLRRRKTFYSLSTPLGRGRHLKYYFLAGTLAASLFSLQAAWFFDPLSLLSRSLSVSVIPAANLAVSTFFDYIFINFRPVSVLTEPIYTVLRKYFLTFDQQYFRWGLASLLMLTLILAAELWRPRTWCRYLCPLGATVSLVSRFSLMGRRVGDRCVDCGSCYQTCPMGLIDEDNHRLSSRECTVCLTCREICPHGAIDYPFLPEVSDGATPDLSRRRLLGGAAAGILAVPFFNITPWRPVLPPYLLRPPGAVPEEEFLDLCIRCGSCMKVCMRNAIHPAMLEGGPEAVMTPVMFFRLGYCELNCTLCGQVCPTGAIKELSIEEKHNYKIGEAFIDQDRCIPFISANNCIVCEEQCPVAEKAIILEDVEVSEPGVGQVTVKRPKVLEKLCIGCGICETRCPVEGRSAIIVVNNGETRRTGEWA